MLTEQLTKHAVHAQVFPYEHPNHLRHGTANFSQPALAARCSRPKTKAMCHGNEGGGPAILRVSLRSKSARGAS